jgi:hypothetical protein
MRAHVVGCFGEAYVPIPGRPITASVEWLQAHVSDGCDAMRVITMEVIYVTRDNN